MPEDEMFYGETFCIRLNMCISFPILVSNDHMYLATRVCGIAVNIQVCMCMHSNV